MRYVSPHQTAHVFWWQKPCARSATNTAQPSVAQLQDGFGVQIFPWHNGVSQLAKQCKKASATLSMLFAYIDFLSPMGKIIHQTQLLKLSFPHPFRPPLSRVLLFPLQRRYFPRPTARKWWIFTYYINIEILTTKIVAHLRCFVVQFLTHLSTFLHNCNILTIARVDYFYLFDKLIDGDYRR